MDFNNVRILGYSHENRFFGDLFRYGVRKSISIEGSLLDLTNVSGVSPAIWSGETSLIGQDYSPIAINGVSFGSGRLINLSFEPGQDLQEKNYVASLEVQLTGNLFNVTGTYYQGVNTANFDLLESFSENFSFSQSSAGEKTFVHSVSLRAFSGAENPLTLAKNIASGLRDANNITGLLSGYNQGGRRYYQETINKITNDYGFTETKTLSKETGNYSIQLTHALNLAENGFVSVTENAAIESSGWNNVAQAINSEVIQSYGRCNEIFTAYGPSSHPLNTKIVTLSKEFNEFENAASYAVTYSNDISLRTGFSWIYNHNIRKSNNIVNISEQGEFNGWGRLPSEKFSAAKNGYDAQKNGILGRIQNLYNTIGTLLQTFRLINTEVSYSEFNGNVSYSYEYSNDPNYVLDPYIKQCSIQLNDAYPTQVFNTFEVANYDEIVQKMNLKTLGARNLSMNLVGKRNAQLVNYLTFAKNKCNQYVPSGQDTYIEGVNYSYNSGARNFSLSLGWKFSNSGDPLDAIV